MSHSPSSQPPDRASPCNPDRLPQCSASCLYPLWIGTSWTRDSGKENQSSEPVSLLKSITFHISTAFLPAWLNPSTPWRRPDWLPPDSSPGRRQKLCLCLWGECKPRPSHRHDPFAQSGECVCRCPVPRRSSPRCGWTGCPDLELEISGDRKQEKHQEYVHTGIRRLRPPLSLTSYVCGHQNRRVLLLEVADDLVPLALVHVSVQEAQAVALLRQVGGQLLAVRLLGDEDQHRPWGGELHQPPGQPPPLVWATEQQLHHLGHVLVGLRGDDSEITSVHQKCCCHYREGHRFKTNIHVGSLTCLATQVCGSSLCFQLTRGAAAPITFLSLYNEGVTVRTSPMSPCTTRIGSTRMSLASLSIFFLKVALNSKADRRQEESVSCLNSDKKMVLSLLKASYSACRAGRGWRWIWPGTLKHNREENERKCKKNNLAVASSDDADAPKPMSNMRSASSNTR